MRNRLAHDYVGVDMDEVWLTVSADVPALITALDKALAKLQGPDGQDEERVTEAGGAHPGWRSSSNSGAACSRAARAGTSTDGPQSWGRQGGIQVAIAAATMLTKATV